MAAMRYGTIPVVTAVGGLRDTVPDADWSDDGNGFVADRVDASPSSSALFRAARLLADRRRKRALVRRIMELDWSWRGPGRRARSTSTPNVVAVRAVTSFQRDVR